MELAILEAKKAAEREEMPVGALIENSNGEMIALEGNRCRELNDPTAHAEMLVIRKACSLTKQLYLNDFTLYVTLEPSGLLPYSQTLIFFSYIFGSPHGYTHLWLFIIICNN